MTQETTLWTPEYTQRVAKLTGESYRQMMDDNETLAESLGEIAELWRELVPESLKRFGDREMLALVGVIAEIAIQDGLLTPTK
jgi:hypothetical protein